MFIITLLDYVNILLILFFGWKTSEEDIKYGRIRNDYVLLMIFLGLVLFILKVVIYLIFAGVPNKFYIVDYLTNLLLMTFFVFSLWKGKLLNAGDSKLLIAYSALIPINFYKYGYVRFFPGTALLINVFTPIFLYLSYLAFKGTSNKDKIKALKKAVNLKLIIMGYLTLFAFVWLIKVSIPAFRTKYPFSMSIILIVLLMIVLWKLKKLTSLIILSLVILRFAFGQFPDLNEIKYVSIVILFLFLIRTFFVALAEVSFTERVKISKLEPGMVIVKSKKAKEGKKSKKAETVRVTFKNKSRLISSFKSKGVLFVKVKTTTPFAHFAFLGVLLTILIKGDLFSFVRFWLFK